MQIRFTFTDNDTKFGLWELSNIFSAIQHTWLYILILSDQGDDPIEDQSFWWLSQVPISDPLFRDRMLRSLPFLVRLPPPEYEREYINDWMLYADVIRYGSPLEVDTYARVPGSTSPSRFKRVMQAVTQLLTIDLLREKARWRTEIERQHAIEAALKNADRLLEISKRIKNPADREEFVRQMSKAITPLVESHPQLTKIELVEPAPEKAPSD